MNNVLLVPIIIVAVLNLVTSILVLRAKIFKREEKRYQFFLVWLLPLVGSLLCLFVMRETFRAAKPSSKTNAPTESPPGIGSYYD